MSLLFEGAIATKAAIEGNKREIIEVLIDKKRKDRDCAYIKRIAANKGIKISLVDKETINAISTKSTHGGIVCYAKEREFQSLESILDKPNPFFCILEGLEDPYNYANALRSLYASGAQAILVPTRNWSNADDVIAKASAGASELIDIVMIEDFNEALIRLKDQGLQLYCAIRNDGAIAYYQADYTKGCILAIGGELRGLSKTIINHCDKAVYIPYGSSFRNSLSAAASSAILGFEVLRQRTIQNKG